MEILKQCSSYIIPIFISFILVTGFVKKVDLIKEFIIGVKEGIIVIKNIFPYLLAMNFALVVFKNANVIGNAIRKVNILEKYNVSEEIITLAFIRPISGGSALSILTNIFESYGVDSIQGLMGSIMIGSTETTLYIISIYFGSVGIKKIRYSMIAGLIADFFGILAAIIIAILFFL